MHGGRCYGAELTFIKVCICCMWVQGQSGHLHWHPDCRPGTQRMKREQWPVLNAPLFIPLSCAKQQPALHTNQINSREELKTQLVRMEDSGQTWNRIQSSNQQQTNICIDSCQCLPHWWGSIEMYYSWCTFVLLLSEDSQMAKIQTYKPSLHIKHTSWLQCHKVI